MSSTLTEKTLNKNEFVRINANSYTATKDCILRYDIYTSNNIYSEGVIFVNGIRIFSIASNSANNPIAITNCWRLNEGDYVSVSFLNDAEIFLFHN